MLGEGNRLGRRAKGGQCALLADNDRRFPWKQGVPGSANGTNVLPGGFPRISIQGGRPWQMTKTFKISFMRP